MKNLKNKEQCGRSKRTSTRLKGRDIEHKEKVVLKLAEQRMLEELFKSKLQCSLSQSCNA